jgi:DNA-binding NtrC family response regulator
MQVKLLRVVQEHEIRRVGGNENIRVDVRFIAATNQVLEEAVRQGRFREDFYYRLNVIPIHLPALQDRPEDIPLLAQHFIVKYASEAGVSVTGMTKEAMRVLMHYKWPGNIRELENVIERSITLGAEGEIQVKDLPEGLWEDRSPVGYEPFSVEASMADVEKEHITRVLRHTKGQVSKAARILGMDRRTLYRKIEAFQISRR